MEVTYKQYSVKEAGPKRIDCIMNDSTYIASKSDKIKLMILKVRVPFTCRKQRVDNDGEGYKFLVWVCSLSSSILFVHFFWYNCF